MHFELQILVTIIISFYFFVDIDECIAQTYSCDRGTSLCANTDGAFRCDCLDGYEHPYDINGTILQFLTNQNTELVFDMMTCEGNIDDLLIDLCAAMTECRFNSLFHCSLF